ncbi:MAG TPA: PAS domain S-box protein [Bacteroidales bacterium]|nr:PAS domain S-box protein [Bacteroidales bacterium]
MSDHTEIKNSDRKFIALLESAPDSMIITGSDGSIIMVNKQTEILFEYSRDEIIGSKVEILIPEKYHKRHRKERMEYAAKPRTRPMGIGMELFGRKKDGTDFPVEVSLSPLHWDITGEIMIIAAIRDVSKQKQAQAELAKRTKELETINRELESFSYSVSHDLRAPLRSIEGFSNKIINEFANNIDDKARGYFLRIIKATRHMGILIDDILKLSRISRIEMNPEYIDISEIAQSISNELSESEPLRRAEVKIQPSITCCADKNLITIALQNLLENAWKYSRKKDQTIIEFGTKELNGNTVYFIKDNGVGFNMNYAGNLFKAFQRLHSNAEFEGTGIGLATVHRIIERHSGDIWAESEENKGTAFYFTLFSKS